MKRFLDHFTVYSDGYLSRARQKLEGYGRQTSAHVNFIPHHASGNSP